jgi:hypothetical protein
MPREFRLKRRERELSPELLFKILSETAGKKKAIEKFVELTGEEPPEEDYEEK